MRTRSFHISTPDEKARCISYIVKQPEPFGVDVREAEDPRTLAQNSLSFRWYGEIANAIGQTPQESRAYCKLHFGIGIVKSGDSKLSRKFTEQYDTIIRPLPYEKKLELMLPPIELPVTSLMTKKQKTEYLNQIQRRYAEQGIYLSSLGDEYDLAMGIRKEKP